MSYHQAEYDEPLLNQFISGSTYRVDTLEHTSDLGIPEKILRKDLNIPDVAEYDVVRHFTRLSQMNFGVDVGFYPLGSCTMKFNPKFADQIASFSEFRDSHPLAPEEFVQGNLKIVYELLIMDYQRTLRSLAAFTSSILVTGVFKGLSFSFSGVSSTALTRTSA